MNENLTLTANLTDALVLGSHEVIDSLDAAELNALSVICDPEGETDITSSYPDEDWEDVWRGAAGLITKRCALGDLFVDVVENGEFFIRLTSESIADIDSVFLRHDASLRIPDGRLQLVQASDLVSSRLVFNRRPRMREIAVRPGENFFEVTHQTAPAREVIAGSFWTPSRPAIVIRFRDEKSDGEHPPYGIANLTRFAAPENPVRITNAIVKRIEADGTLLDILVSPNVRSGYAIVKSGTRRLSPGEKVRIRLLEKTGGRWRAELLD